MKSALPYLLWLFLVLPAPGCDDNSSKQTADGGVDVLDAVDDGDIVDLVEPNPECTAMGLSTRALQQGENSPALKATAGDFTLQTRLGAWNFYENFSGCDSYLFIQDAPAQATGWPTPLWERDVDTLFSLLPPNVHLFFVSTKTALSERSTVLDALSGRVSAALAALPPDEEAHWQGRIHYVEERAQDLPDYLGALMTNPAWGFAIDRFQRIRYIGSYADLARYNEAQQWFEPNLAFVSNEPQYYNFEALRDDSLRQQGASLFNLFQGEVIEGEGFAEVTLPSSVEMAEFDHLEFDLATTCQGSGEYGFCPAWDRIVSLYLCDESDPETCDLEVGRWITTYHREGRWVHDVTPLLPLIKNGGVQRFRFVSQDPWEITLTIRLATLGKAVRPIEAIPLFQGNNTFDETYNSLFAPMSLAIPEGLRAVRLATLITGHGMSAPGNCAEFCNTTHHFYINDGEYVRDFPQVSNSYGCMQQVSSGTVPNQYGTWWYGRSGWCPGKEVQLDVEDITTLVTPGEAATIAYEGYYNGAPYTGDNWRYIDLASFLVFYE